MRSAILWTAALLASAPVAASAQSWQRVSLEASASVDHVTNDDAATRPQVVIDVVATIRLGGGWQAYVRPWFLVPRSSGWNREIYQAALRYERPGTIATRVELGYIGSPIGLGMLDMSPATNPLIGPHLSYFVPMMPFDPNGPPPLAIASTYPLGGEVSFSGRRWDARAALVASSPTQSFALGSGSSPRPRPVFAGGAGITPRPGLRLGVSLSRGAYLTREEFTLTPARSPLMTMAGLEGEYAFRYTRISGEWLHDRFETAMAPANASTWFVQGVQTLSARWFAAARREQTAAPISGSGAFYFGLQPHLNSAEADVGFRVTPDVTLRGGWSALQFYGSPTWTQRADMSVVWSWRLR